MVIDRLIIISLIALAVTRAVSNSFESIDETVGPKLEQHEEKIIPTPGISGSFDYSDFEAVREPLTRNLLRAINKINIPNIPLPGGSLNNNNLTVY